MKRVYYIDTLRCLASGAVLAQHVLEHVNQQMFQPLLGLAPGVYGVVLFFYLSGVSIPLSVRNNPPLAAFALRRVFRIFPAYLTCLMLVAACAVFGMTSWRQVLAQLGIRGLVANLLLVQDWVTAPGILGVTWTLSLEFVWYGLFALISYAAGNRRAWIVAMIYAVGLLVLSVASLMLERRLPLGRVAMVGAALIGYITVQWQDKSLSHSRYWMTLLLFLLSLLASQIVSFGYFVHPTTSLFGGLSAWCGATLTFLIFALPRRVREGWISRAPVAVFLGTISYSVYLTHGIVISVLDLVVSGVVMIPLCSIVTIGISWLIYERIEKPGIVWGRRVERVLIAKHSEAEVSARRT